MGMSKLTQIVALFQMNRKVKHPFAIIQNGTTAQKNRVGTINTIEQKWLQSNS
jgi:siroheme synthase